MIMSVQKAKFSIGDIVKHKHFEFRGVIYDVDFEFNNSEEKKAISEKNSSYSKKVIEITKEELESHKQFLKKYLKKNFF